MAKTISGHSTPKSAMAMAIVAIPVAPPLNMLTKKPLIFQLLVPGFVLSLNTY